MNFDSMNFNLSNIKEWIKNKWEQITLEHIIYLLAISYIISVISDYILKFKEIKWLYYSMFLILLVKLIESNRPVDAVETIYKLALI
jgi:hypothetical protein